MVWCYLGKSDRTLFLRRRRRCYGDNNEKPFHKTINCALIGSLSDMPTIGSLSQDYGTMIFEIKLNNFGSLLSAKFFHDQLSMLYLQNSEKKIEKFIKC